MVLEDAYRKDIDDVKNSLCRNHPLQTPFLITRSNFYFGQVFFHSDHSSSQEVSVVVDKKPLIPLTDSEGIMTKNHNVKNVALSRSYL